MPTASPSSSDVSTLDTVPGGSGADSLSGTADADLITGLGGNDTLSGLAGDDTLDGGAGNDSMSGGDGNDTYIVNALADIAIEDGPAGGIDTVRANVGWTLGAHFENLTLIGALAIDGSGNALANQITGNGAANALAGGDGDDTLVGGAGNDSLDGGAGEDSLFGGLGADSLVGGLGNDIYNVDDAGDTVVEGSSLLDEIDTVRSSLNYTLGANLENLVLLGDAVLFGTGNSRRNQLTGNSADNLLSGAGGNDTLNGGSGGDDSLFGGDGQDSLLGGSGVDALDGGAGRDTLNGGAGADALTGGVGNDTYIVDDLADGVSETTVDPAEIDTVQSTVDWTLGDHLERLVLKGGGAIDGTGNALGNVITGTGAQNLLSGLDGDDTLKGGGGADTLDGAAGADTLDGGLGNDVYLSDGLDTLVEANADAAEIDLVRASGSLTLGDNLEQLRLVDGAGAIAGTGNGLANALEGNESGNALAGLDGDDTLTGNDGADTLTGGSGADLLTGGGDDDRYADVDADDTLSEQAGGGSDLVTTALLAYTLPSEIESLSYIGVANGFVGVGNGLANTLTGAAGSDDQLNGAAGADTMTGLGGNDVYVVDNAADVVVEAGAGGSDQVRTTLSFMSLPDFVESLSFTGVGNFTGFGRSANETLSGGDGNDTLDGFAGADQMIGGLGNDRYTVEDAGDTVVESSALVAEVDTVIATVSFTLGANVENLTLANLPGGVATAIDGIGNGLANTILGNSWDNTITGNDGNDSLVGGTGVDSLSGGNGSDTLDGGSSADTLIGGDGNDTYIVRSASNVVTETSVVATQIDTVQATVDYTLGANVENLELAGISGTAGTGNALANQITGNSGNNALSGSSGTDTLSGGDGDDALRGGAGFDSVIGGNGADDFVFDALALDSLTDYDRIPDFVSGTDDLVFDNSVFLLDNDADLIADVLTRAAPGGWGSANEVVIFTTNVAGSILATSTVVTAVGSASAAIAVGDRKVFAIDNGTQTSVWLFRSDAADAAVSATELTLVAYLTGTSSTSSLDYLLVP